MSQNFYSLKVLERIQETQGAVSIILERPSNFDYKAGQHLPIRFRIDGKEARRTYTISSSPIESHLKLTVKRVKDGLVSNYWNYARRKMK